MTRLTRLAVLPFLVIASASVIAQGDRQSPAEFRRMLEMGLKYRTAFDLYSALKATAGGGRQSPPYSQLPDWSGLWTSAGGGTFFDPGPGGVAPKLTPAAAAMLKQGAALQAKGIEYDENLSQCGPPGFPRWLVIPFLREFIVRPEETWLSSETTNNIRRIYTDGRGHPPEDDRYPLYYGDSIGFWDGQKLVIHTNQLMARSMGRNQPTQSEEMETVEIWQKVNASTVEADAWIYDPALYVEPWYMKRRYSQVTNADSSLRIRYSWLLVDVTNKDGSVTTWGFEAEGPSTLMRNGVRPADFRSGTKLTIIGHPMKDGRPGALWVKAVRADGKEFYPGGRRAGRGGQQ